MDAMTLVEKIKVAFSDVVRDEELTLHQAQLADQGIARDISDQEWFEARKRDPEEHWADIPRASLLECDASMSHLSPQGWAYYLPAFMLLALKDADIPIWENWVTGDVLFRLTLDTKPDGLKDYYLQRFEMLDVSQKQAVAGFLEYFSGREDHYSRDADIALRKYWCQYAT